MTKHRPFAKLLLETLEDRDVPATLVSPTMMTFQDVDGDMAAVVFSKPVLAEYNVNSVFWFQNGSVDGSNAQKQKLLQINLVAPFAEDINGVDMTVKVISKARSGDGEVHVGEVYSLNTTFGKLNFLGDVNRFTMFKYDGDRKLAESISVNSTGRFDPEGNSQESHLAGYVGSFLVRGDLVGAVAFGFNDNDGDFSVPIIGTMEVRGSVKGSFYASDRIDSVVIRGNIDGTAYPNPYPSSFFIGRFAAEGGVGTFSMGGSVLGGAYGGSGQLYLNGSGQSDLGTVTIGGSIRGQSDFSGAAGIYGAYQSIVVKGSIIGGAGMLSGVLNPGEAKSLMIAGSVRGGSGFQSGRLSNSTFAPEQPNHLMDKLVIQGGVIGGNGNESGSILMMNPIERLMLTGAIQGGNGTTSGTVRFEAGVHEAEVKKVIGGTGYGSGILSMKSTGTQFATQNVEILGPVMGNTGDNSGQVEIEGVTSLRIYGSVVGSSGEFSGRILMTGSNQDSGLHILGDVKGGSGARSGSVNLYTPMALVSIRGDVKGAAGVYSGTVEFTQHAKTVMVGGHVQGGVGNNSGSLVSYQDADTIRIGKSVIGGNGAYSGRVDFSLWTIGQISVVQDIVGGRGDRSGVIAAQAIDAIRVGGSVIGSDGYYAGGINVTKRLKSASITHDIAGNFGYVYVGYYLGEGFLDSITVGGNVVSSAIISTGAMGTVTVRGSIRGTASRPSYVISYGAYPPSGTPGHPYLLKSISVGGDVHETQLIMGSVAYPGLELEKVGTVNVGKNWSNSTLTVGYTAGADQQHGTDDDVRIKPDEASTIDSVFIGGKVLGNRQSVVQAGLISQMQTGKTAAPLTPGEFNDDFLFTPRLRLWEKV